MDSKKYSNEGILRILESHRKEDIIELYRDNFLYIRDIIEALLQAIIDRMITLPYPLRYICKIINLLISKKFPFFTNLSD